MIFDNYRISLLGVNDGSTLFELIDSNRQRLEDFFAGTSSDKSKPYIGQKAWYFL